MGPAFNKDGASISVEGRAHSYRKAGAIPIEMPEEGKEGKGLYIRECV